MRAQELKGVGGGGGCCHMSLSGRVLGRPVCLAFPRRNASHIIRKGCESSRDSEGRAGSGSGFRTTPVTPSRSRTVDMA